MGQFRSDLASQVTRFEREVAQRVSAKVRQHRWLPQTKIAQVALKHQWMESSLRPFPLETCGFRVFSQFEEDGMLLAIFSIIGEGSKTFVDLGSSDGISSNCANLAVNHGWWGVFVDGDQDAITRGRRFYEKHPDTWVYPPKLVCAHISRESVDQILDEAGVEGEIDLLSIDIDGNDYWVWHALEQVQPRVVIIETHVALGMRNVVVPYDPSYRFPGSHPDYHGASVLAMEAMANQKGYRLVGSNAYGFNTIWIKGDEGIEAFPAVSVDRVMRHRRTSEVEEAFARVAERSFLKGGTGFPGTPWAGEERAEG